MTRTWLAAMLGAAALSGAIPAAAGAGVACAYDEDTHRLDVRVRGVDAGSGDASVGHIVRDGPLIRVIRQNEANGVRRRADCGGAVRADRTSSVTVSMRNAALGISVHRGPLPPVAVRSLSGWNVVFIGATGRPDTLRLWRWRDEVRGYVGREDESPKLLEIAMSGEALGLLQANGRRGDDLVGADRLRPMSRGPQTTFAATGGEGDDRLAGSRGSSILAGGVGRDRLLGGPGPDVLVGGRGRNRMVGGRGDDRIDTGDGRGVVFAGAGSDFVDAEEGFGPWGPDRIDCGSGHDGVDVDRGDRLRRCELGLPRG
jgi:RTX calcium-binding nonapeptide repeat (4 copies)